MISTMCISHFSTMLLDSKSYSTLLILPAVSNVSKYTDIHRASKRWTRFRTSIFPELYMVCE